MAVTNAELILAEQARLYEEGLIELDEDGMFEPLYTMAVWNKMGYMIVKGQSSAVLWNAVLFIYNK